MSTIWTEIKRDYFPATCWFCYREPAVHLHHGIVSKGKLRNRKMHKYLDVPENAVPTCDSCHASADSWENRQFAWKAKCAEFGEEHMRTWYNSLNLKVKDRY